MKCPYRTEIREYQDGLEKVQKTDFADCIEHSCPYWGRYSSQKVHRQEGGVVTYDRIGCRRVEKECS